MRGHSCSVLTPPGSGSQYAGPIVPQMFAEEEDDDDESRSGEGSYTEDEEDEEAVAAGLGRAAEVALARKRQGAATAGLEVDGLEAEAKVLLRDLRAAQDSHYAGLLAERDQQLQAAVAAQGKLAGQLSRAAEGRDAAVAEVGRLRDRAGAMRFHRRLLKDVLAGWAARAAAGRLAARAIRRLASGRLWQFFGGWAALASEARQRRAVQAQAFGGLLRRLMHRDLSRGWLSWSEHTRRRRLGRVVAIRFRSQQLAAAFGALAAHTGEATNEYRCRMATLVRVTSRLRSRQLAEAFDGLAAAAAARRRVEVMVERAVARMRLVGLGWALRRWTGLVEEVAVERSCQAAGRVGLAFGGWRAFHGQAAARRVGEWALEIRGIHPGGGGGGGGCCFFLQAQTVQSAVLGHQGCPGGCGRRGWVGHSTAGSGRWLLRGGGRRSASTRPTSRREKCAVPRAHDP